LDVLSEHPISEQRVDSAQYCRVNNGARVVDPSTPSLHHRLAEVPDRSPSGKVVRRKLDSSLPVEMEQLLTGTDACESETVAAITQ
jgi:hypothetical protein